MNNLNPMTQVSAKDAFRFGAPLIMGLVGYRGLISSIQDVYYFYFFKMHVLWDRVLQLSILDIILIFLAHRFIPRNNPYIPKLYYMIVFQFILLGSLAAMGVRLFGNACEVLYFYPNTYTYPHIGSPIFHLIVGVILCIPFIWWFIYTHRRLKNMKHHQ